MFHIKQIELVHWDFWRRFTLPLDSQIITIVGPNGSGKTTLLDALRTCSRCAARAGAIFAAMCAAPTAALRGSARWSPTARQHRQAALLSPACRTRSRWPVAFAAAVANGCATTPSRTATCRSKRSRRPTTGSACATTRAASPGAVLPRPSPRCWRSSRATPTSSANIRPGAARAGVRRVRRQGGAGQLRHRTRGADQRRARTRRPRGGPRPTARPGRCKAPRGRPLPRMEAALGRGIGARGGDRAAARGDRAGQRSERRAHRSSPVSPSNARRAAPNSARRAIGWRWSGRSASKPRTGARRCAARTSRPTRLTSWRTMGCAISRSCWPSARRCGSSSPPNMAPTRCSSSASTRRSRSASMPCVATSAGCWPNSRNAANSCAAHAAGAARRPTRW